MTSLTTPPHVPAPADSSTGNLPAGAFSRNYRSRRTLVDVGLTVLAAGLTLLACVPLFSVLFMLLWHGGERLVHGGLEALTSTRPPPGQTAGGGFGNAIVGTLLIVTIASLIAIPFGILGAIFLAEYGPRTKLASAVRFAAKVMTGLPSILAGVFAYAAVVLLTGDFSAVAGGVALAVLMIPIVMLTAEGAIKMVPQKMREAAIGMGATQAQVTWKVVVPTALTGILTGVMLAVARAAGETAPLLFAAAYSDTEFAIDKYRPHVHLWDWTASLSVFIYENSPAKSNVPNQQSLAWAAALVLVLMVLAFNIGGQLLSRKSRPKR